jgi:hypothetical protein
VDIRPGCSFFLLGFILDQLRADRLLEHHIRRLGRAAARAKALRAWIHRAALGAAPHQFNMSDDFACHFASPHGLQVSI